MISLKKIERFENIPPVWNFLLQAITTMSFQLSPKYNKNFFIFKRVLFGFEENILIHKRRDEISIKTHKPGNKHLWGLGQDITLIDLQYSLIDPVYRIGGILAEHRDTINYVESNCGGVCKHE
jgi:hypothetical protein